MIQLIILSLLKHFLHLVLGTLPYLWPLLAPLVTPLPFPDLKLCPIFGLESVFPLSLDAFHLMAVTTTGALTTPKCMYLDWICALNSQLRSSSAP